MPTLLASLPLSMLTKLWRKSRTSEAPQHERARHTVEIIFLDEEHELDEDTFMHLTFVPRKGEEIWLDGDFRRRGSFVVERVAHSLVCNGRRAGWVQDDLLDIHTALYVREKEAAEHGQTNGAPVHA